MKRGPKTNKCADRKAYGRAYYATHREEERKRSKLKNLAYRITALEAYGGKCVCCGETNSKYLTFDHINNDGAAHRRALSHNGSGCQMVSWLRRNHYPRDIVQILCANCNHAKAFYGGCDVHS